MSKRGAEALKNYRLAEMKRLLDEGVALSKVAKMLGMTYQLAKTYTTLENKGG